MRRALKILAAVLVVAVIAAALMPWWFGTALSLAGGRYGLKFQRYERLGYERFALHGASYEHGSVVFKADRVELDSPLHYLLKTERAHASVQHWELSVRPAPAAPKAPSKPAASHYGAVALHETLDRVFAELRVRLPQLSARDGAVRFSNQLIEIDELEWRGGVLRASGRALGGRAVLLGFATQREDFAVTLHMPEFDAGAELRWTRTALSGHGTWWQQPWQLDATFGDLGWLPRTAKVNAADWNLPAERAKLGAQFDRLRGGAEATWSEGTFQLRARADANPRDGAGVPALRAVAEANGTPEFFTVTTLDVDAPFAQVKLTAPVAMTYRGQLRSPPALLALTADLAKQPWFKAAGKVTAAIELAGAGPRSRGEFSLQLDRPAFAGVTAQRAELRGVWEWPRLELAELHAQLDATSEVRGSGALDWERREIIGAKLAGKVSRAWFKQPLPAALTWNSLDFEVTADGPLEAPRNVGSARAQGFAFAALEPLDLRANWRGQELALEEARLEAHGRTTRLAFLGSVDEGALTVRELSLAVGDEAPLKLTAPTRFAWNPVVQLAPLRLENGRAHVAAELQLGPQLRYSIEVANLDAAWWRNWVKFAGPDWHIATLTSRGAAVRDFVQLEANLRGEITVQDRRADVELIARGDADGLSIERFTAQTDGRELAGAKGRLPIVVASAPQLQVRLNERAPLEFDAKLAPESPVWALIETLTGLNARGASVEAVLRGSVQEPTGELRARASELIATRAPLKGKLPKLTDVSLVAHGDRRALAVNELSLRVEGNPVAATAQLPMDDASWTAWRANPREFPWQRLAAKLALPEAEIASLTRSLADSPVTQGRVKIDGEFSQGRLRGSVEIAEAGTRPLPSLGIVQGINAKLLLDERTARIQQFEAKLGGEPLRLGGEIEWTHANTLRLDLSAEAKNLPLVRRPGLLVRTDLKLQAKTQANGLARLSGTVRLRDTLVMADLAALLPGGPRGTARRPPYFSVPVEPFANWPIDIAVRGPRAVRVRTAVFDGVATPQFQLSGTLGDPRAVGQLAVDEGRVLFPFATFEVQAGSVRLSEADPYTPRLNVNAAARRHGYDLSMEATGSIEKPNVAFRSNPPLEAAEVLLMVATGQPPSSDSASLSGQQRLTQLGTYLGRGLFKNFGSSGSEDRLEISSGEEVSRGGRETYQAEYKVNDKLSITGEYDQYDAYNAGIKYRIFQQGGGRREQREP